MMLPISFRVIKEHPIVIGEIRVYLVWADSYGAKSIGYMINRINLQRAIDNICSILNNTTRKVIIYDHHMLRDFCYKERIAKAYDAARVQGKTFLSAAEWLGYEPLILRLKREEHV